MQKGSENVGKSQEENSISRLFKKYSNEEIGEMSGKELVEKLDELSDPEELEKSIECRNYMNEFDKQIAMSRALMELKVFNAVVDGKPGEPFVYMDLITGIWDDAKITDFTHRLKRFLETRGLYDPLTGRDAMIYN